MHGISRVLALVAVALAVLSAGCGTSAVPGEQQPPVELRTYDVPPGYESEVRSMLRTALGTDENRVGRVDLGPGGKLVVVGPRGVHAGVERLVDELARLEAPPPAPVPVTLSYWILVGRPLGEAPAGRSYTVVGGVSLDDVAPALEEITKSQGATEFALLERLHLSSIGDEWARVAGRRTTVEQRASPLRDSVVAQVRIQVRNYGLSTQVKLRKGQILVLGQTGYEGDLAPAMRSEEGTLALYHVIAADLES